MHGREKRLKHNSDAQIVLLDVFSVFRHNNIRFFTVHYQINDPQLIQIKFMTRDNIGGKNFRYFTIKYHLTFIPTFTQINGNNLHFKTVKLTTCG